MLKLLFGNSNRPLPVPAAFGRLCVETEMQKSMERAFDPAAFGRLCVETAVSAHIFGAMPPAAFGRLCVET